MNYKMFLLLLILSVALAFSQNAEPKVIVVNTSGSAEAQPDVAIINFGVETDDGDISDAMAENSKAINDITASFGDYGISDDNYFTKRFNVYPHYRNEKLGKDEPSYYKVINEIQAKLEDFKKLPAFIEKIIDLGANRLQGIVFDVKDKSRLEIKARTNAINEAKKIAKQLAKDAGVKLKGIVRIEETGGNGGGSPEMRNYLSSKAPHVNPPGQISVNVNLRVVFEIE